MRAANANPGPPPSDSQEKRAADRLEAMFAAFHKTYGHANALAQIDSIFHPLIVAAYAAYENARADPPYRSQLGKRKRRERVHVPPLTKKAKKERSAHRGRFKRRMFDAAMDRGASNDEVWRIVQSSEDELRLLKAHEDDYYPPAPSQYNVAQESGQQYRPMCPLPSRSLSSYPPAEPAYEYGWEEENQSDEEDDFQDQQLYENDRQFGR